jgi:glyoxylase-like metal-dependent hydrolase (beta-lactamase superfamily II)
MVSIEVFCFNAFAENTFLIISDSRCIIVDPGCYEPEEYDTLKRYISDNDLTPQSIINTHCHIDHILGVDKLKDYYNIPFYFGKNELQVLKSGQLIAPAYGFNQYREPEYDGFLTEGEEVKLGDNTLKILDVPGHSPGHIALYEEDSKICIAGDVLFQHSIGRTDLPGGDFDTLINSIRNKLFNLPGDVIVYPGHGPETSISEEKRNNPYCGVNAQI